MDVRGAQLLAADGPVATLNFMDLDPGHAAHGFAFHGDHGFGDFADHVGLLVFGENVLDDIDGNERHILSPLLMTGIIPGAAVEIA